MEPLQGTATGKNSIARVTYTHDAMIDLILQQPGMNQTDIAAYFGYTQGWVSRVMGSDAFNARLAQRKEEIVNPAILATVDEKLRALAHRSIDVLMTKLDATQSPEIASKGLELSTKALGLGARPQNVQTNNTYVVALPPKSDNELAWADQAKADARALSIPRPQAAIDVPVKELHRA